MNPRVHWSAKSSPPRAHATRNCASRPRIGPWTIIEPTCGARGPLPGASLSNYRVDAPTPEPRKAVRLPRPDAISLPEARRIALAAQGFAQARPRGRVGVTHFRRVVERVRVVQLDSVNVLARAHHLTFFARLGPYRRDALDRWLWQSGEMYECWAHAASLIPTAHRHLLVHRIPAPPSRYREQYASEHADFVSRVLSEVAHAGPITSGALAKRLQSTAPRTGWWGWSEAKIALEHLFVAVRDRVNFQRRYDLPERVHTPELLARETPTEEARLELLALSASALGIATFHDLVDYYRLPLTAMRAVLPKLVERGDLLPATVEGWTQPAYLHREAARPRHVRARSLLGPFDSLIWAGARVGYRERVKRLFDFEYRIGIYDRAADRTGGYYVLPFLLGDRLVARVDVKADHRDKALLVRHAALEAHADAEGVAPDLQAELASMASWLSLERIVIEAHGPLADALRLPAYR